MSDRELVLKEGIWQLTTNISRWFKSLPFYMRVTIECFNTPLIGNNLHSFVALSKLLSTTWCVYIIGKAG